MNEGEKKVAAIMLVAFLGLASIPFLFEYSPLSKPVNTSPLYTDEKLVLSYYYPWFHNGTNYTGALGGEIEEKNDGTEWSRWGSPTSPNYNYTVASTLNESQVYYWKNGGSRNYSWASIAQWPTDGLYDVANPIQIGKFYNRSINAGIDVLIGDFFGDYGFQTTEMKNHIAVAENRSARGLSSPKITFMLGTSWGPEQQWWGPTELDGTGWGPISHSMFIYQYVKSYLDLYGNNSHFFQVNGKPVFFTWATYKPGFDVWKEAMDLLRERYEFYIIVDWGYMKPGPIETKWLDLYDGSVFYNPVGYLYNDGPVDNSPNKYENLFWLDWENDLSDTNGGIAPEITRHSQINSPTIRTMYENMKRYHASRGKFWAPTVIPGYDDRQIYPHENSFVGRSHTTNYGSRLTYCGMWEDALSIDPEWVMICSFNEIHEGTEIDHSVEYGDLYMKLTQIYSTALKTGIPFDKAEIDRLEQIDDYTLLNETGLL